MYHVMVLMVETGVELDEVKREMASRHIVEHKIKQEKMVE
jgi:phosphoribosyl-ATP pyrophosphohydrolase/phosphoribosyl-AMP cyclohydrolase